MASCVVILGGSFDPVHNGHLALAEHFMHLFHPEQLLIIPAGQPWQKSAKLAEARHRTRMIQLAFESRHIPATIDRQEIERQGPSYSIDTLRQLRTELGPDTSIVFLIGADQLQRLDTWKAWRELFELAHICVAARPGYTLQTASLPAAVMQEFDLRIGSIEQIRSTPSGLTHLSNELAFDISATDIRAQLKQGKPSASMLPEVVLDYIQQFHLYQD